ncbi:Cystatin [Cynara cardunculus var. scolymus]|uniref:Cystatin n=2 Tax=Cynara cardunculus var. scolymus TaxID=59895 RepID=A0A103Y1R1_CYNCS|nr:Cystatin [Cynara cardunculus var. scolymus]
MDHRQSLFVTILIVLLTLMVSNSSMAVGDSALTGGWEPITNVTDPTVLDIGKFAVDEHNKQHKESLKFTKVVSGKSQVVAGRNYNLTITATDGGVENNYVAIVWDKPWENFRQLLSFKGPI